jgi:Lon protease-like protein
LHEVGCTAELRSVRELPDGRYDIDTVGGRRFRLLEIDDSQPYHRAQVEFLDEAAGPDPAGAALRARAAWGRYQQMLGRTTGETAGEQLPADPRLLGYALSCTGLMDLSERQDLLAAADDTARLQQVAVLLHREAGLLAAFRAVPDPSLLRERPSLN